MKSMKNSLLSALVLSGAILPALAGACEITWQSNGFEARNCTAEWLREQLDTRRNLEVYDGRFPVLMAQMIELPDLVAADLDVYPIGDDIAVRARIRNDSDVDIADDFIVVAHIAISDPDAYNGYPPTGSVYDVVRGLDAGQEIYVLFWERLELPPTTHHWDIQAYLGVDLTSTNVQLPRDGGRVRESDENNNIRHLGCRMIGEGPHPEDANPALDRPPAC